MDQHASTRNAVIGAAVTIVLSFTGASPLLGGGVAGYLQGEPPRRGARIGALAGGIAVVPIVAPLLLGFGLLRMGLAGGPLPGAVELAVILFVLFPLLFVWDISLSALGGYLGAVIRSDAGGAGAEPAAAELD